MPAWWQLTPQEEDELPAMREIDPVNSVKDPAHPLWLEEQEWPGDVAGQLYVIFTALADERDLGYMDTPPMWAEEPTDDTRDWGVWAFHGTRAYSQYEN